MTEQTPGRRRPTQADVARLAGVSQTTVSQVLNNSSAITVPVETRQRILASVERLGYVPDHTARSLRTRKTSTIACAIPDIANPFYPAFARGIQDIAEQHGYELVLYNTDGIAAKESKAVRLVQQGRAAPSVPTGIEPRGSTRERDADRYAILLREWQLDSRVRLLAARMTAARMTGCCVMRPL